MPKNRGENGFTLLEILAVLFLIATLASIIVLPNILKAVDNGRVKAAGNGIAVIENCLLQYKLGNGTYPTTGQGLTALRHRPDASPVPDAWDGPYAAKPIPDDPWGHPYVYVCPGEHNQDGFDLSSLGADGFEGGTGAAADITNWAAEDQ